MAARTSPTARTQSRWQRAKGFLPFALCALLLVSITLSAQRGAGPGGAAAPAHPAIGNREAIAEGEKLYNETCTSCHGKDGTGGELGPPVAAQNRRYLRRTDQEIFDTIKNGITGTQMPPYTGQFTDDQIWRVTAYIRGLRGTAIDTPAAGDVAGGEAIFWSKGNCGGCHMVKGKGSILGPDLSILRHAQSADIVDALTKENHKIAADGGTHDTTLLPMMTYQPVRITTGTESHYRHSQERRQLLSAGAGKDDLNLYRFNETM